MIEEMKVEYDKTEISKVRYSGVFLICLMLLSFYFIVRDREIAVLIVIGPVILIIIKKVIQLFVISRNTIKYEKIYLELKENRLIYNTIYNEKICIELSRIKDIQFNEEGLFIYMDYKIVDEKKKKRNKLFQFYIENNDNMYKIPILGKKEKIKIIFEKIKKTIDKNSVNDKVERIANLFGNYIFIIIGIMWSFEFHILRNNTINKNILEMLLLIVGMIFLHRFDKKSLEDEEVSFGGIVRCIGCSLTIAQYILCACQIEEVVNRYSMDLIVSMRNFVIISFVYLVTAILFLPANGLGKRIILYSLKIQKN